MSRTELWDLEKKVIVRNKELEELTVRERERERERERKSERERERIEGA